MKFFPSSAAKTHGLGLMEKRWIPASKNLCCEEVYRNTSQELKRDCKRDIIFSFLSNLPGVSCIDLASEKRGCFHQILMGQLQKALWARGWGPFCQRCSRNITYRSLRLQIIPFPQKSRKLQSHLLHLLSFPLISFLSDLLSNDKFGVFFPKHKKILFIQEHLLTTQKSI